MKVKPPIVGDTGSGKAGRDIAIPKPLAVADGRLFPLDSLGIAPEALQ